MGSAFGRLLREKRKIARRSMGELAKSLDVSIPYISDVERGSRNPFSKEKIYRIAEYLNIDPKPLLVAAAEDVGGFRLDVLKNNPQSVEVGAALMRGWPELSEEQLEKIREILKEEK
jgi:transcriptional regulator with XRE-family HTH domain